jgi:outer membrane immunogenic protein
MGFASMIWPVVDLPGVVIVKKLLFASIALVAQIAGPAIAADLPIGTPVYAPPAPVIYSWWTGCYLGGNMGAAWSRIHYTHDNAVVVEDFSFNPTTFIGGFQLGCQYQWNDWVVGVEGTWSGTGLKQTQPSVLLPNVERSINVDQIATVTGRLGYAWDRTMLYVKGGWAGVRSNVHAVNVVTGVFGDFTEWSNGWTVGAGVEHVPWKNIVVGMELNYYNATFDHSGVNSAGGFSRTFNSDASIYALTLRVSYLFGPPVVTNY